MLMPADSSASTAFRAEQAVVRAHFQGSLNGNGEVAEGATAAWKMVIRRGLNVTVAVVALLILLPFMFVVAVLIRLTSPGPILYTQPRVGVDRRNDRGRPDGRRVVDHGGRLFRIYKFRTMYVNADFGGQRWASPDDPRVTPLGRILRRYRLDELPQIWNVLVGDMNLVGPRPEQPRIFAELRGQIPGYVRRQRVLPGITGLAQINQSYDRCVEDVRRKVNYDLEYIERVSPLQDLRILLATLPAVVVKRGGW